jgi:hypothetical protein
MPITEISLTAKLLDFLSAGVKWQPQASNADDMRRLLALIEQHSAFYNPYDLEIAGRVASSIREVRKRLGELTLTDGFAREAQALIQLACSDFQARAEKLGADFLRNPDAVYSDMTILTNAGLGFQMQFTTALGELRGLVKIVLEAVRKKGIVIPPGLERGMRE